MRSSGTSSTGSSKWSRTETDSEDENYDGEEKEIPEESAKDYDPCEREWKCSPIRTDPKNEVIKLHADGEMPQGEKSEINDTRPRRNVDTPNRYRSIKYRGIFWG